jgi:hypothetical protein
MRQIELDIKFDGPRWGVKILSSVPEVGGLFVTETAGPDGPQIKMFPSLYQAQAMANSMNSNVVEIVEFVSAVRS